jgi:hypothetical protein
MNTFALPYTVASKLTAGHWMLENQILQNLALVAQVDRAAVS